MVQLTQCLLDLYEDEGQTLADSDMCARYKTGVRIWQAGVTPRHIQSGQVCCSQGNMHVVGLQYQLQSVT